MTDTHDESDLTIAQRLKAQCSRERRIAPAINWLDECRRDGTWPSPKALEIIASISVNGGKQSTKGDPDRGEDIFTLRNCIGANMVERHEEVTAELRKNNPKLSVRQAKDIASDQVINEFKDTPHGPRSRDAKFKLLRRSDEEVNAVLDHREDLRRKENASRRRTCSPLSFTGP